MTSKRNYCSNCKTYYLGDRCKTCQPDIPDSGHKLTPQEVQAMQEATDWYRKHYLGYPYGKYHKCFFSDVQQAFTEIMNNTENAYQKSLRDKKFGRINHFTRVLTYAWEYGHIPNEFEDRLKYLHRQSIIKLKASPIFSDLRDLQSLEEHCFI